MTIGDAIVRSLNDHHSDWSCDYGTYRCEKHDWSISLYETKRWLGTEYEIRSDIPLLAAEKAKIARAIKIWGGQSIRRAREQALQKYMTEAA